MLAPLAPLFSYLFGTSGLVVAGVLVGAALVFLGWYRIRYGHDLGEELPAAREQDQPKQ